MWFWDLLDRKQAFLDRKNFHFLKSQNWRFLKGLTHDLGQKFELFYCLFLSKFGLKMSFDDLVHRKQAFLDYKNIPLGILCGHIFARTLGGEVLFGVENSFFSMQRMLLNVRRCLLQEQSCVF